MSLDLGDHTSEIPINTNLSEEEHRLLEVSLSICQNDPNQWSIDEWIEALAGALIHRYLINDGTFHPSIRHLPKNPFAFNRFFDQAIESDQIHQSLKTLLAVQMLLSFLEELVIYDAEDDEAFEFRNEQLCYLTGIVDHNINELNDWIASISREKLTFFGVKPQARSLIDWSKIQIMRLLSI